MHTLIQYLVRPGALMEGSDETHKLVTPNIHQSRFPPQESVEDVSLELLLEEIRRKHGDTMQAILVYGSWLRGKRDTMLDFYVLVDDYQTLDSAWQGWMCRLLPPNVYHIHHKTEAADDQSFAVRAKYALLSLSRFCDAMQHDFHSYFWARFAQPCEVLYVRDETVQAVLTNAFKSASATFLRRALPAMEDKFSSRELWTRGLSLTYQCELRTENSNRGESIYEFEPAYYDSVTNSFAQKNPALLKLEADGMFCNQSSGFSRKTSSLTWWLRRVQGKLLSMLRLFKAAFTFNEPMEYLLWKIERHSGIYIEPSTRQLKHPLIFAWPLIWKLYRQGAFR